MYVGYMSDLAMKKCTKCNQTLNFENFGKSKVSKDGYTWHCKKCLAKFRRDWRSQHREEAREYAKQYRQKHPEKYRSSQMKSVYGITIEQYNKMFEEQKGLCAICGLPESHKNMHGLKGLSIDHNHNTDKVRGLLCNNCNLAIGQLKVDSFGVLNLQKAIEYLRLYE